ncbi:hypothetical protein GP5015_115 [gamma proteobacterium HTCC5015]|nr:hypothetical protein GP5015_115 [gamma proteobacterium HTCC5015]
MSTLKQRMAENGFESNESYDFVLKALRHPHERVIPCLNVEGDGGRRKTAFANALAHAIDDIEHHFYHDFSQPEPTPAPVYVKLDDEDEGKEEPPVPALDRALCDACAYSEGEPTILILDQLHEADFKDQIRLYQFLSSHEWPFRDTFFSANYKNLMVFIVSEEPVYHSLQKQSFRVWVDAVSDRAMEWTAEDFGLDEDIQPVMDALAPLFEKLEVTPTYSEYQKILRDIPRVVHTAEDLANTVFGWTEGVSRPRLRAPDIQYVVQEEVMPAIEQYIGVEDIGEIPLPTHSDD